jgi:nucleoside-diphosphate-sugar epimerase
VFHLAGQTSIYEAKKNPVADLESNVLGLLKLMEYLKTQSHCPIVIITGAATQAGINRKNPINEKTRDNPCTFYDISKLSAEMYLKQYIKEGWIQGCALRLGNVYGKRQDSQNINRGILDKIYLNISKDYYEKEMDIKYSNVQVIPAMIAWSCITISYYFIVQEPFENKYLRGLILAIGMYGVYNSTNLAILPTYSKD